jgi:hypothetical protein
MGVDHGRLDILVAEEFPNGPDDVGRFQHMGGPAQCGINSGAPEGVAGGMLRDAVAGWRRRRAGPGGRAPWVVRVGSGERSRADPIWPPLSVVPERCAGQEPTLDVAQLSSHRATAGCNWNGSPFELPSAFPCRPSGRTQSCQAWQFNPDSAVQPQNTRRTQRNPAYSKS